MFGLKTITASYSNYNQQFNLEEIMLTNVKQKRGMLIK